MSGPDINRLKWQVIEVVTAFFKEHCSERADDLSERFVCQYESLIQGHEKLHTDEDYGILALIEEFRPALSSVLQTGDLFDGLVMKVSPILNAALSRSEKKRISDASSSLTSTIPSINPRTQYIHVGQSAGQRQLLSVGIDIGSSTSHLVFSKLTLARERSFQNPTNRFQLVDRRVIYEGNIIFTPLLDHNTIDIEAVVEFCREEYEHAGVTPEMVDTGAVLVTGETAKKSNAQEIVERLSSESGKFVSAAAGPNLEAFLSAMGSGIVDYSREKGCTVLHVDIGGGTSNLAIASEGHVISTACINVGGRLLGIDENLKIWRIDEPSYFVMKALGIEYQIGDTITEDDARLVAREYARALIEVMTGPAKTNVARKLMMTDDLDFSVKIDEYSLSGGVAELFYGNLGQFDDIGKFFAEELSALMENLSLRVIEPEQKIRATVIGAGAFTLSVSGSTSFSDETLTFPIENIPVIPVDVTKDSFSPENVTKEIHRALKQYDIEEGVDLAGLYFKDPIYQTSTLLQQFVNAIGQALPYSVEHGSIVVLLFGSDIGRMVGLMLKRETPIDANLLCLDELELEAGDWIDVGTPLDGTRAFPVTVKSLVFNKNGSLLGQSKV